MNSTIYMFKSIPTKDSQFPQLLKCFEMEFGPQKSRVLVPLYPLLSLSRLPISSFGQEGCCEKILYDMGEILKNFAHLKNILCPPSHPPAVYIMNAALAELKNCDYRRLHLSVNTRQKNMF